MNELQIFNNQEFGEVRTTIKGNEPMFCLSDVCKILGIKNASDVVKRLDVDEVTRLNLGSLSGETNFINESGLYTVILRSDKPKAREFRKWVTGEVLPQIRRTGNYLANASLINELRAELTSSIDSIVNDRIQQIETKCSKYYRPSALTKTDLVRYIKSRLYDEDDYNLVKQRVLLKLNATKWEDIPVEELINSLNVVDESIRIINLDSRSKYQTTIFD